LRSCMDRALYPLCERNIENARQKVESVEVLRKMPIKAAALRNHFHGRKPKIMDKLAIVVAALAFLATAWQAWVANDSEKRQLRAYIGVHQIGYQGLENADPIGFGFAFVNHGQTLARDFNLVGIIDLLPYPLPANFELPSPPDRPPQDGIIFPNETSPMVGWVWERQPMTVIEKKGLLIRSPSKQIYMHGVATYKDIFNRTWETKFCFFLNPASTVRDNSGAIVRDKDGNFGFQVSPCAGRNNLR
jgi:hypothetical protein